MKNKARECRGYIPVKVKKQVMNQNQYEVKIIDLLGITSDIITVSKSNFILISTYSSSSKFSERILSFKLGSKVISQQEHN